MDAGNDPAEGSPLMSSDRLASLSDTMFGVAMTLVATSLLPAVEAHKGSVLSMLRDLSGDLICVVLSFGVSARYWVSQQQRLAMMKSLTPHQTVLHLAFLFLIVLVPISTSLPGLTGSDAQQGSVMIYGTHLALLSLLNLLLWIEVHRNVDAHLQIVGTCSALGLLVIALAVGALRPGLALYVWILVMPVQPLTRALVRHMERT